MSAASENVFWLEIDAKCISRRGGSWKVVEGGTEGEGGEENRGSERGLLQRPKYRFYK